MREEGGTGHAVRGTGRTVASRSDEMRGERDDRGERRAERRERREERGERRGQRRGGEEEEAKDFPRKLSDR